MSEIQTEYNLGTGYKDFNDFAESKLKEIGLDVLQTNINILDCEYNKKYFLNQIRDSAEYDLDKFLSICFRFALAQSLPLAFIINTCMSILESKKHDYSEITNRYSNFEFTTEYARDYVSNVDGVFVVMLGIKVARLVELIGNNKTPKNEKVLDSVIDLMNYRLLLEGYEMGLKI